MGLLQSLFIGLTVLMFIILTVVGSKIIDRSFGVEQRKKKKIFLVGGLAAWIGWNALAGNMAFFENLDFPPRFFIFLILPAFIFTGVFVAKNKDKQWVQNIPTHWLMFYQSFRILIESIFVLAVAEGILPEQVTVEGYNYDMFFGFSALIIGAVVLKKSRHWKKIVLAWNYLGLAVIAFIIFLFLSTIFFYEIYGSDEVLMSLEMTRFPYVLVAGFLMPSAVFVHVLSIAHLNKLPD